MMVSDAHAEILEEEAAANKTPEAQYAAHLVRKKELEAELRLENGAMRDLEPEILDRMATSGMDRVAYYGLTLFPKRRVVISWDLEDPDDPEKKRKPTAHDRAELAAMLRLEGMGDMIKESVTLQQLTSYYKEEAEEAEDVDSVLPERLKGLVKLGDFHVIGHRKG